MPTVTLPSAAATTRFILLPIQKRDFTAFVGQWRVAVRIIAAQYQRMGLIIAGSGAADRGLLGVLRSAARGWWNQWIPLIAEGWRVGSGEGVEGRLGGVAEAIWAGRNEIVRDGTAVCIGFAAWTAVWLWIFNAFMARISLASVIDKTAVSITPRPAPKKPP